MSPKYGHVNHNQNTLSAVAGHCKTIHPALFISTACLKLPLLCWHILYYRDSCFSSHPHLGWGLPCQCLLFLIFGNFQHYKNTGYLWTFTLICMAQLQWHLSNMNVIQGIDQVSLQTQRYPYKEMNGWVSAVTSVTGSDYHNTQLGLLSNWWGRMLFIHELYIMILNITDR